MIALVLMWLLVPPIAFGFPPDWTEHFVAFVDRNDGWMPLVFFVGGLGFIMAFRCMARVNDYSLAPANRILLACGAVVGFLVYAVALFWIAPLAIF